MTGMTDFLCIIPSSSFEFLRVFRFERPKRVMSVIGCRERTTAPRSRNARAGSAMWLTRPTSARLARFFRCTPMADFSDE